MKHLKNQFHFMNCKYSVTDGENVGEVKELIFSFEKGKDGAVEARRFRDEIKILISVGDINNCEPHLDVKLTYNKVHLTNLHLESVKKKLYSRYEIVFVHYNIMLEVEYIAVDNVYFPNVIGTCLSY